MSEEEITPINSLFLLTTNAKLLPLDSRHLIHLLCLIFLRRSFYKICLKLSSFE